MEKAMDKLYGKLKHEAVKMKREAKRVAELETPLEKNLREATSNQNWGCPNSVLYDLCYAAQGYNDRTKIMAKIWEKLQSKPDKWRRILKTLTLLEFLLKNGTDHILGETQSEQTLLRRLVNFQHVEEGKMVGGTIREKAKHIIDLLGSRELMDAEREKAQAHRVKFFGATGRDGFGGGESGGGCGGGGGGRSSVGAMPETNNLSRANFEARFAELKKKREEETQQRTERSRAAGGDDSKSPRPRDDDEEERRSEGSRGRAPSFGSSSSRENSRPARRPRDREEGDATGNGKATIAALKPPGRGKADRDPLDDDDDGPKDTGAGREGEDDLLGFTTQGSKAAARPPPPPAGAASADLLGGFDDDFVGGGAAGASSKAAPATEGEDWCAFTDSTTTPAASSSAPPAGGEWSATFEAAPATPAWDAFGDDAPQAEAATSMAQPWNPFGGDAAASSSGGVPAAVTAALNGSPPLPAPTMTAFQPLPRVADGGPQVPIFGGPPSAPTPVAAAPALAAALPAPAAPGMPMVAGATPIISSSPPATNADAKKQDVSGTFLEGLAGGGLIDLSI